MSTVQVNRFYDYAIRKVVAMVDRYSNRKIRVHLTQDLLRQSRIPCAECYKTILNFVAGLRYKKLDVKVRGSRKELCREQYDSRNANG